MFSANQQLYNIIKGYCNDRFIHDTLKKNKKKKQQIAAE